MMLAKEFEELPLKDAYSNKRVMVSQTLLFQGEEGNQKVYTINLKKVVLIYELWTQKKLQEQAGSIYLFKMYFILGSV